MNCCMWNTGTCYQGRGWCVRGKFVMNSARPYLTKLICLSWLIVLIISLLINCVPIQFTKYIITTLGCCKKNCPIEINLKPKFLEIPFAQNVCPCCPIALQLRSECGSTVIIVFAELQNDMAEPDCTNIDSAWAAHSKGSDSSRPWQLGNPNKLFDNFVWHTYCDIAVHDIM